MIRRNPELMEKAMEVARKRYPRATELQLVAYAKAIYSEEMK